MQSKADILSRLRREVLQLQGFKTPTLQVTDEFGLGPVATAFPNGVFPRAAVHEFCCAAPEEGTAAGAFVAGLLSTLMKGRGVTFWIGTQRKIYPPALRAFGIRPEQVVFLDLRREKDAAWAVEEALKCSALSAVVGELSGLDFMQSRRYQLAVEGSGVPCFVLQHNKRPQTTAAACRWQLRPQQSAPDDGLPGLGHPRWEVRLLKVRGGRPGCWSLEWRAGRFQIVNERVVTQTILTSKSA